MTMKKILSTALAAVLSIGMTTVAFAAVGPADDKEYSLEKATVNKIDGTELEKVEIIKPGDVIYAKVKGPGTVTVRELKNDRITPSLRATKGSKFLKKPEFKTMGTDVYVRMETVEDFVSTKEEDIRFTLGLAHKNVIDKNDNDLVVYDGKFANETYDEEIDSNDATYDATMAHVFKVAKNFSGKVTFDFGDDIMYKNVRVFSEQKFYLKLTRDAAADISEKHGNNATLDFYNFMGDKDKFTSVGTLMIPTEGKAYAYERTANGLQEVKHTYNAVEGAVEISTNTLGNYVISDKKLDVEEVEEPALPEKPSNKPGGGNNNPPTGRPVTGMAVTISLLALAAAGTLSGRKK